MESLGLSGPCPFCGAMATAPTRRQWEAAHLEPSAPRSKPTEAAKVTMPGEEKERTRSRNPFRRNRLHKLDGTGPSLPQILGWATMGLFFLSVGFAASVAGFTVSINPPQREISLPKDLTAQALQKKMRLEESKAVWINQAVTAVTKLAQQGDGKLANAGLKAFSFASTTGDLPAELLSSLKEKEFQCTFCARKPGEMEFFSFIEPTGGSGPVFLVEQSNRTAFLHADALTQQLFDGIHKFLESQGDATLTAYVLVKPSQAQLPVEAVSEWPKLDVKTPFPVGDQRNFVVSAKPETTTAADAIARRDDPQWQRAVMTFRWSATTDGKRFIELQEVLANIWEKF